MDNTSKVQELEKIVSECFHLIGFFNYPDDEFDYLVQRLKGWSFSWISKLTPEELFLGIQAGLSEDPDFARCGKKLSLLNIKCFIQQLFRRRCDCEREANRLTEPVTQREYLSTVFSEGWEEKMPELAECLRELKEQNIKNPYQRIKAMKRIDKIVSGI